jgi:hypothetical protein
MAKRANVEKYADVINFGNALHTEYKAYEQLYIHRAHDELYELLEKIYGYVKTVLKRTDCEAVIAAVRRQLKDEYGINTTAKTGEVGVLLRLILKSAHKKTLFTYKRTLQLAIEAKIEAHELSDFIKRNNGIDKLSKSTEAKKLAADRDDRLLSQRILASYYLIACEELRRIASVDITERLYSQIHDKRNGDGVVFAACKYSGGKLHVLDFVNVKDELNNKLLDEIFKAAFDKHAFMDNERKLLLTRTKELESAQVEMPLQIAYGEQVKKLLEEV